MVEFFYSVTNDTFEIANVTDHRVPVYRMQLWKLSALIAFFVIFSILGKIGQLMIIWYLKGYAPKNRPINRMILVDQVRDCIRFVYNRLAQILQPDRTY